MVTKYVNKICRALYSISVHDLERGITVIVAIAKTTLVIMKYLQSATDVNVG